MLDELRTQIDATTKELLSAFEKRMHIVGEIARHKRANGIPVEDETRERDLFKQFLTDAQVFPYYECKKKLLTSVLGISKWFQRHSLNLYLIGMPGCGKSTMAQVLSKNTNREFVDTDTIISDRAEADIPRIFELEGESGFREREHEALLIVAEHGNLIVATGGGMLTYPPNLKILKNSGYCVFLDKPLDSLIKTPITGRPLVDENSSDDLTRLYYERIVDYKTTADAIFDPESPDTPARIIAFMHEKDLI